MLIVFRYGHRIKRDKRLTTHVALISRAFLADKMIYSGDKDNGLEESIMKLVCKRQSNFVCEYEENWFERLEKLKNEGYLIVHLTVNGEGILKKIDEIKEHKERLVVVVGSKKVSPKIYKISDYNIAITNQPHSEAGALAIFLNEITERKALES